MKPGTVLVGILSGCLLIAFGLIPGLLQALIDGVNNFRDSLLSPSRMGPRHLHDYQAMDRPMWLAGLGTTLVVITLLAYFY